MWETLTCTSPSPQAYASATPPRIAIKFQLPSSQGWKKNFIANGMIDITSLQVMVLATAPTTLDVSTTMVIAYPSMYTALLRKRIMAIVLVGHTPQPNPFAS